MAEGDGVAGTYEVLICRGRCDPPQQAMSRGHIVVEAAAYPLSQVPEPARSYFSDFEPYLVLARAEGNPNACFVLEQAPGAETYAGSSPVGLTKWGPVRTGPMLRLPLFQSPDAGYTATLLIRGGELHGSGRSYGFGDAAVDFPPDTIVGRRVGPPDRGLCIRAAEAELAGHQP